METTAPTDTNDEKESALLSKRKRDEENENVNGVDEENSLADIPNLSPLVLRRTPKKLLVLDINGILVDIVPIAARSYDPDIVISSKSVFRRPFCTEFIDFCFQRFNVGIWSSRVKKNLDELVDFLFQDSKHKLLFCWDQSRCTDTGYPTLENRDKPLFLKEIRKLWENIDNSLPWKTGEYDESNTIMIDDSPYKALRNPAYTAIFPHTYRYQDYDSSLGPRGEFRMYLDRLANAENVQKFVADNPFGKRAITERSRTWGFYRRIVNGNLSKSGGAGSSSVSYS